MLRAGENGGKAQRFEELFYRSEGLKSGMHHRDGILWIRTPELRHTVHAEKVPLERIAPMILDMFSLARPPSMAADPLSGYARLCAAS
jgi:predicted AlkP superfamily phosphohydrolase/phosphomutase